ncbi:thioredoxin domain-containing protein [Candidatus Peregrinibacteria bacterium]|nr:thioredoxin domain-containing protein [Candidatus Peregrinibacteria bacterium]MBI3816610.1 thioredoxin domain-containing protein [Candidatus Peregrinibacteria bacterium]
MPPQRDHTTFTTDAAAHPSDTPPVVAKSNPWMALSIGLLGLIAGYVVGAGVHPSLSAYVAPSPTAQAPTAPTAPAQPTPPAATAPATGVGPTLGKADASVTIVEFTDFQCPFCSRHFQQTFRDIKKNYVDAGKVKYELRMFPLTSIHQNAMAAAEAAMCANAQGKFWEMHDTLFSNQGTWSGQSDPTATFKTYASDAGVNAATFARCLTNHTTQAQIQKDMADGSAAGITGTPGFWIEGPKGKTQLVSGAYPYATFQTAFDSMLSS